MTSGHEAVLAKRLTAENVTPPSLEARMLAWPTEELSELRCSLDRPTILSSIGETQDLRPGSSPSGLWHQVHARGQALQETLVRIPGPRGW